MLGKLVFEGQPLRDLLLNAIRYGEQPEVRARLDTAVDQAFDRSTLQDLLEERQLVHDAMDASGVQRVRAEMERADARRLQPHYIESFFREAFGRLGGAARQREPRRYEVTHVPAPIRSRDRAAGIGEPVLPRYERIVFEKPLVSPPGPPLAAFVCPGHPLLDAVIDLTLERHRDLLTRGAVLVDERDDGMAPRVLFSIEHALQDGSVTRTGDRRVMRRMLAAELPTGAVERRDIDNASEPARRTMPATLPDPPPRLPVQGVSLHGGYSGTAVPPDGVRLAVRLATTRPMGPRRLEFDHEPAERLTADLPPARRGLPQPRAPRPKILRSASTP